MEDFLLWVIGLPLVGIAFVSIIAGMRKQARNRVLRWEIVRCRVCGHLYKDKTREKSPECPECESINERGKSSRLG